MMKRRVYSRNGGQFLETLESLQAEGFGNWLITVYGAEEPAFEYGAFYFDDDLEFSEVFANVAHEFSGQAREIAIVGVTNAIVSLAAKDEAIHPFSIFALSRIAMSVGANDAVVGIKHLLEQMLDERDADRTSVLVLRETLENVMRLVFARMAALSLSHQKFGRAGNHDEATAFGEISAWCSRRLVDDRYVRELTPAYAPMFFLSLVYYYGFRKDGVESDFRSHGLRILMDNFGCTPEWASDLAVYTSNAKPGTRGPYNLDAVIASADDFIAALTKVSITGRYASGRLERVVDAAHHSLTHAGFVGFEEEGYSEEVFVELERQVVGPIIQGI